MFNSGFTIDTAGMENAITKLESLKSKFFGVRDALFKEGDSLLNGNWEGSGADAFERSFGNIRRYFDDDMESLDTIVANLITIRDAYLKMDADAAAKIEQQITGG